MDEEKRSKVKGFYEGLMKGSGAAKNLAAPTGSTEKRASNAKFANIFANKQPNADSSKE